MNKAKLGLLLTALGVVAFLARPPGPPLRLPDAAPVLPRASSLLALFFNHIVQAVQSVSGTANGRNHA